MISFSSNYGWMVTVLCVVVCMKLIDGLSTIGGTSILKVKDFPPYEASLPLVHGVETVGVNLCFLFGVMCTYSLSPARYGVGVQW